MRAVAEQVRRSATPREQKSDRREISLGRVAGLAREDEIVAPIVGGLAASRGHVVERHRCRREALTAVGTDGSVPLKEPPSRFGVGDATGRMRRELQRSVRGTAFRAVFPASASAALRARMLVVVRQGAAVMMVRRTALEGALLGSFVAVGRVVKMSRQNRRN